MVVGVLPCAKPHGDWSFRKLTFLLVTTCYVRNRMMVRVLRMTESYDGSSFAGGV
jgi:hypothetical protein